VTKQSQFNPSLRAQRGNLYFFHSHPLLSSLRPFVIPAPPFVIPAQAGIQYFLFIGYLQSIYSYLAPGFTLGVLFSIPRAPAECVISTEANLLGFSLYYPPLIRHNTNL